MHANARRTTTVKKPAQIRVSGSLERLRAYRYAADPKAVVLTYICACSESTITGEEVRTCKRPCRGGQVESSEPKHGGKEARSFPPAAAAAAAAATAGAGVGAGAGAAAVVSMVVVMAPTSQIVLVTA